MKPINLYLDEAIDRGLVKNDSELSSRIGVTRTAVSNWRSGKRTPDDDEAVRLADLLGKDAGELLAECGAARAKTPETRRAWERIAARMAASGITACVLAMTVGHSPDVQASISQHIDNLDPVIFRTRLLGLIQRIFKKFRYLHTQRCSQSNHRVGRYAPALHNVAVQCGVRYA